MFFIFESQGQGCRKQESILGYDHTTLRRHMASKHKVPFFYLYSLNHHLFFIKKKHQDLYRSWCTKNKFISMLPEDTKFCKLQIKEKLQQTQVNNHFKKAQPENKPEPYSDELFKEAAIQWLVETDQVCIVFFFASTPSLI